MNSNTSVSNVPQAIPESVQEAAIRPQDAAGTRSSLGQFFGVYVDPRTWGALLFVLLSLVTGILYFTWAVAGLSLSLGFLILIIGLPFAIGFLLSVRGLIWMESRLVGALLGVRLQRNPAKATGGTSWLWGLKALLADRDTWRSLLYLVLQLPLGVIYFTVATVVLAFSLSFMALPVAFWSADQQSIMIGSRIYAMRSWIPVAMEMAGFLMLTVSMHVVRGIGRLHGRYAKALLGGSHTGVIV